MINEGDKSLEASKRGGFEKLCTSIILLFIKIVVKCVRISMEYLKHNIYFFIIYLLKIRT